jgi:hypothetical protein
MKRKRLSLMGAAGICAISLVVMVLALQVSPKKTSPGFIPPPFEENAVTGIPDVPQDLGWSQLDAKVYQASICGVLRLDGQTTDVWFTNPQSNTVWLKLRVLDEQDHILGETGILKPGEYVRSVHFDRIPEHGQRIRLKLMGYEPDTYHSAGSVTMNTTIEGGASQ